MEIEEGHLFTHASKEDAEDFGGEVGLLFTRMNCLKENTLLSFSEIKELPRLNWTPRSTLWLYGCQTGLPVETEENKTMAHAFFERQQSVNSVVGQTGKSYFSYDPERHQKIRATKEDTRDIYLWAFDYGRNASGGRVASILTGSNKKMNARVLRRP